MLHASQNTMLIVKQTKMARVQIKTVSCVLIEHVFLLENLNFSFSFSFFFLRHERSAGDVKMFVSTSEIVAI